MDILSFTPQIDVPPSSSVTSNTITLTGLTAPAQATLTAYNVSNYAIIKNGINVGLTTQVANGDTIAISFTSNSSKSVITHAVLDIADFKLISFSVANEKIAREALYTLDDALPIDFAPAYTPSSPSNQLLVVDTTTNGVTVFPIENAVSSSGFNDGKAYLFAADYFGNKVQRIDPVSGQVVHSMSITGPYAVHFTPLNIIGADNYHTLIACPDSNTVYVYDGNLHTQLYQVAVGNRPVDVYGGITSVEGDFSFWVACFDANTVEYYTKTGAGAPILSATYILPVGSGPNRLFVYDATGDCFVSLLKSHKMAMCDISTTSVVLQTASLPSEPWDLAGVDNWLYVVQPRMVEPTLVVEQEFISSDTAPSGALGTFWELSPSGPSYPDISTMVYDNVFLDVAGYDTLPTSVYVSPDGHHLLFVGYTNDKVHQFSLPTANSLTGAVYVGFFSVAAQETTPHGLTFSPDGTRMFMCGLDSDKVWQYNLATPWVITSGVTVAGSVAVASSISPNGVCIIGSRMYVSRWSIIYQYTLTAGDYDITGGAPLVGSFSTAAYGNNHDVVVLPSGDTMYTDDPANDVIHQWALTDFDVTSAIHVRSFSVATQSTEPTGICFSASGEKLFIVDSDVDKISQYSITPSDRSYFFRNDGSGWDISTLVYDGVYVSIGSGSAAPSDCYVSPDGHHLFVLDSSGGLVNQFYLPNANSLVGQYFGGNFSVAAQEVTPNGITFKPDGTKMFIVGSDADKIWQYSLATAWTITSGVTLEKSIAAPGSFSSGLDISADGKQMLVSDTNAVRMMLLPTAWDIEGATVTSVKYFSPLAIRNGRLSPDGKVLYLHSLNDDSVYQYSISNWDMATAVQTGVFNFGASASHLGGCFSHNGLKYFNADNGNDRVNQFSVASPWKSISIDYVQIAEPVGSPGKSWYNTGTDKYLEHDGLSWVEVSPASLDNNGIASLIDMSTFSAESAISNISSSNAALNSHLGRMTITKLENGDKQLWATRFKDGHIVKHDSLAADTAVINGLAIAGGRKHSYGITHAEDVSKVYILNMYNDAPPATSIPDYTPSDFELTATTNRIPPSEVTSNAVVISGISGGSAPMSIPSIYSAKIIVNGVDKGASTTVVNGDSVSIRITPGSYAGRVYSIPVLFESYAEVWEITNKGVLQRIKGYIRGG